MLPCTSRTGPKPLHPATLGRPAAAIAKTHAPDGYPSPASLTHLAVEETLKGVRRTHSRAQAGKLPLVAAAFKKLLADLVLTLKELSEPGIGIGFASLTEALDMTTPSGRVPAGMLAVFAEFERKIRAAL